MQEIDNNEIHEENSIYDLLHEKDSLIDDLSDKMARSFIANIDVLSALTSLIDRFYDGSHSKFVSEKSVLIADQLNINDVDKYELKIAALLHDIGKLAYFDSAMFKYTNEMSAFEFDQYTKHVDIGMHILKRNPDFERIAEIVYQHHERLDGTGFPRHLKSDFILPEARIISIVDFFHSSVYKKPRTRANAPSLATKYSSTHTFMEVTEAKFNYALNHLYKKRDILFDKKAVDIFIDIIQLERMNLGKKSVMRIPVNKIEPGMVFAEDYYTKFGILIAAKGESVSQDMIKALVRFAENDQIPMKILVLK